MKMSNFLEVCSMSIENQYNNLNFYSLGEFFVAEYNGKFGIFHSYVDTGFCYGEVETYNQAEKLKEKIIKKYINERM